MFEQEQWRAAITQLFAEGFAAEDATRWHPEGATGALDASRLTHSVPWVHCDYAGKPSWAHSDAVVAAYREGADYAYRTNDDSKFPEERAWADIWIESLRGRTPVANLGVVGPTCHEGATWILTHDFTHKTHGVVFGFQYPRGLPDWSSDDWITFVYDAFGMMRKEARTGASVLGTRGGFAVSDPYLASRISPLLSDGAHLHAGHALRADGRPPAAACA